MARTRTAASAAQPATRTLRSGGIRSLLSGAFGSLFGSGRNYIEAASQKKGAAPADVGPNGIAGDIEITRRKSRWAYVNNAWYRNLINSVANNVVDYGMTPIIPYPDLKALWETWVNEADSRGEVSFYGMQWVAVLAAARDGEVIFRYRDREDGDMLSGVPLQIQMMEADHLPLDYTQQAPNGNWIVSGVERNAIDRVNGYWLYPFHPKDWTGTGKSSLTPSFVPARDVLLMYMPGERIGANRGYPWAASALNPIEGVRGYDISERERKRTQANYSVFYTKPMDEEEGFKGNVEYDGDLQFEAMQPNSAIEVPEGYNVSFPTPTPTDGNYDTYHRWNLSEAAVSVGFSVELVTLNFKDLSDRQARVMANEIGRRVGVIQYHMLGRFNERTYARWVSSAILAGRWTPPAGAKPEDYLRVKWMPAPRGHIHPVQEVNAYKEAVKAGFKSRSEVAAEYGEDVVQIDMENAADQARARALKLSYSVYPELTGEATPLPDTVSSVKVDAIAEADAAKEVDKLGTAQAA